MSQNETQTDRKRERETHTHTHTEFHEREVMRVLAGKYCNFSIAVCAHCRELAYRC